MLIRYFLCIASTQKEQLNSTCIPHCTSCIVSDYSVQVVTQVAVQVAGSNCSRDNFFVHIFSLDKGHIEKKGSKHIDQGIRQGSFIVSRSVSRELIDLVVYSKRREVSHETQKKKKKTKYSKTDIVEFRSEHVFFSFLLYYFPPCILVDTCFSLSLLHTYSLVQLELQKEFIFFYPLFLYSIVKLKKYAKVLYFK